jgi:hypothetical protein
MSVRVVPKVRVPAQAGTHGTIELDHQQIAPADRCVPACAGMRWREF